MKKLIMLTAVGLGAFMLNAATVTWTVSGVKTVDDATVNASGYSAFLFYTASTVVGDSVVSYDDVIASITAGTFASDYSSKAIATGTTATYGNYTKTGLGSYGAGDSVSAFTVIFDAASIADAENYAVMAGKTASFTSATGAKTLGFTNFSATTTWQAVPEPTSGLLMLVGLAGLALRRRRA